MRAVQSVYIAPVAEAAPSSQLIGGRRSAALAALVLLVALPPARADVVFENCQPTADGGITCDTRPTGNTQMDDEAARYGLFNEASPGWSEFDPDQGFEDDFGGNET